MYGGPHKSGRGGGGGRGGAGAKRTVFTPPNPSRPSSASGGRLSMGGSAIRGRNPPPSSSSSAPSAAVDESFSLVARTPLSFAATLRLPPDLVEEIKRAEAQGGAAKIKFDINPNNTSGNVIDVGGKEFRFIWSREMGDLCDIYEEPPDIEDSNGLLVESGCAYRKLNVQRTLDESTKKHLKMRSEEADRKNKTRKTVVLDPSNPSMKSQIKALAAADGGPWKSFQKNKKEPPPFKKRKFESNQAGGPPTMVHKSGFSSASSARHSASPQLSPPVQSVSLVSPSVAGNPNRTPANTGAATPINATGEDNKSEKDASGRSFTGLLETTGRRATESSVTGDLQSILTSLLKDNPNGMSLKALEKAVGDLLPGSSRKIDPILKKIATYQAPGRYILNSEAERLSLKRCSQSGSSPEGNGHQIHFSREKHDDVASEKVPSPIEKFPSPHERPTFESFFGKDPDFVGEIDVTKESPDPLSDKNNEGKAARSNVSRSGSDSDSDSSDSGSGSQSRSRSPAGSGSGSSSDSESDSSSNSKEGSDVEVDILSDDENEPKPAMQVSDQGFPTSPGEDVDIDDDQEDIDIGTASDLVPISEAISTEEFRPTLPNQGEHDEHWTTDMMNEPEYIVAGAMKQENQDRVQRSKGKSKKAVGTKKNEEASDHGNRSKSGSYVESPASNFQEFLFSGSSHRPDTFNGDHYKDSNLEMEDRYDKDDSVDLATEREYGYHQAPGKVIVEPQQPGRRPSLWSHDSDSQGKSGKHARKDNIQETPVKHKNKMHRDKHVEKGKSHEKIHRKAKESGSRHKHAPHPNSLLSKHPDQMKISSDPNIELSQQDGDRAVAERIPPPTGRNNILRRELSDLELGELREPLSMEFDGNNNNQFQRQGSFKQLDTKVGTSDSVHVRLNKGKPAGKPSTEPSSPVKGMRNGSSKRSPSLYDEVFEDNVVGMEGYGETHKQALARRQNDSKQEHGSISGKGTKSQKSNPSAKGVSRVKDASSNDGRKSESSSDENSSFAKYEKEKADLKEPIKDLIQYKEYVQEYTEKYSTYCSLNNVLENFRNDFHKMGKDLESAKSMDMSKYYSVLRQLRESYLQQGEKHKRLKKIFVVLHDELKHLKQMIKDFAAAYSKD